MRDSDDRKAAAPGVHLWLVLWKASHALREVAQESIASLGMCLSDFAVLEALLHKGPLAVNEIGRKVMLTSGSITTAVDRLERRGLVERRALENDRRARMVHLTGTGRALIRKLFAAHERDMGQAAAHLTAREIAALTRGLRTLGQAAEAMTKGSRRRKSV